MLLDALGPSRSKKHLFLSAHSNGWYNRQVDPEKYVESSSSLSLLLILLCFVEQRKVDSMTLLMRKENVEGVFRRQRGSSSE